MDEIEAALITSVTETKEERANFAESDLIEVDRIYAMNNQMDQASSVVLDYPEEETDEGTSILNEILAHGLKTNQFNDPVLTKKLDDYLKKERQTPLFTGHKKQGFSPRINLKKKDKKKDQHRSHVKGLPEASASSSEEEVIRIGSVSYGPDKIITNSEPYMPLPNDTPDYDAVIDDVSSFDQAENSDEQALLDKMSQLCLSNKEKAREERKQDQLKEIREFLDQMTNIDAKIENKAWRDMFLFSNRSDYVHREDLEALLCSYQSNKL